MELPSLRRRIYRLKRHSSSSTSMDSDVDPSSFPFDLLPIEIQSRILGLLPITTLVVCRAVSPSWRSIIRSPDFLASYRPSRDPIFLLWTNGRPTLYACAYLPSTDRWINFHFPQSLRTAVSAFAYFPSIDLWTNSHFPPSVRTVRTLTSSGTSSLILGTYFGRYYIVSPFSAPPHPVINFLPLDHQDYFHYALAFIEYSPSDYEILLVNPSDSDALSSQIYHSLSGKYEPCPYFPHTFSSLESAVYLDGLVFCLSCSPDHLLTFNPVAEEWAILDLGFPLPSSSFRHLLTYGGELYLTAALEDNTAIVMVGIWELDRSAMTWREFGFMPAEYLTEFRGNMDGTWLPRLEMVDCMGVICFLIEDLEKIVMCDLAVRRWWCPKPCNTPQDWRFSVRLAIEPRIDLLK